jgi:hypothetical protein
LAKVPGKEFFTNVNPASSNHVCSATDLEKNALGGFLEIIILTIQLNQHKVPPHFHSLT